MSLWEYNSLRKEGLSHEEAIRVMKAARRIKPPKDKSPIQKDSPDEAFISFVMPRSQRRL